MEKYCEGAEITGGLFLEVAVGPSATGIRSHSRGAGYGSILLRWFEHIRVCLV